MKVKQLAQKWGLNPKITKTAKEYRVKLRTTDAARVATIAEMFNVCCEEDVISDLLTAALDDFEASLPYKQGTKIVAYDEEDDPIFEDAGLTPRFLELKEEKLKKLNNT